MQAEADNSVASACDVISYKNKHLFSFIAQNLRKYTIILQNYLEKYKRIGLYLFIYIL